MKNRKPTKAGRQKELIFISIAATLFAVIAMLNFSTGNKHVEKEIEHLYSIHDPQFLRTMDLLLGPAFVSGNKIEALRNGDEIFPAMLSAIRQAKKSINFETYIYWSESIGNEFADALCERAKAGVKVHVLVDWLGSDKLDKKDIEKMKSAGVEFQIFNPLRWYNISDINNHTHRKLLIIDGHIGFTGGVGISDQWRGNAQDEHH